MSYLQQIQRHNNGDLTGYIPFLVENVVVGNMRPVFAEKLVHWPGVFVVSFNQVELNADLTSYQQRTDAVANVLQSLLQAGDIRQIMGEPFPVTDGIRSHAFLEIDRAVIAYFGVTAFGQHLNGYVRHQGEMKMWIARRAFDRFTYPGLLDQLVAGGLPAKISLAENLAKECYEEAGISAEMASQAVACGAVTYFTEGKRGIKPDVLYCYDLELAQDFVPVCTDGEVDSFRLLSMDEVVMLVKKGDQFKPNCHLVIIDFLIRHGFIGPEEDDYLVLQAGLHGTVQGVGSAADHQNSASI